MKRASLIVGLLVLIGLWCGPLAGLTTHSFAAHMTLHMGVVAVGAPLIAVGLAGGRFDPVRARPDWFPPIPLSMIELVVVWTWHAPAVHHFARGAAHGFVAEQASFFVAGMWVWLSAIGGDVTHRQTRAGPGVVALLLTSMHMTLLGALLALTPEQMREVALFFATLPASSSDGTKEERAQ